MNDNYNRQRDTLDNNDLSMTIIGKSSAIRKVFKQIKDIAPTSTTVLIEGETGTGKELIAQTIHHLSPRRDRPFMAILSYRNFDGKRIVRSREGGLHRSD